MEIKVQLPFQELLHAVKLLSPTQKMKLRQELAEEKLVADDKATFVELLMNGPVYTEEEIRIIEQNTKSISAWRTKD